MLVLWFSSIITMVAPFLVWLYYDAHKTFRQRYSDMLAEIRLLFDIDIDKEPELDKALVIVDNLQKTPKKRDLLCETLFLTLKPRFLGFIPHSDLGSFYDHHFASQVKALRFFYAFLRAWQICDEHKKNEDWTKGSSFSFLAKMGELDEYKDEHMTYCLRHLRYIE